MPRSRAGRCGPNRGPNHEPTWDVDFRDYAGDAKADHTRPVVDLLDRLGRHEPAAAREHPGANGESMKKDKTSDLAVGDVGADDILPEYDFSRARPNKYAALYQKGGLTVTLDPEVAKVFPSAADVNEALRSLARLIRAQQRRSVKKPRPT